LDETNDFDNESIIITNTNGSSGMQDGTLNDSNHMDMDENENEESNADPSKHYSTNQP
jgi:hypothetical protein